MVNSFESILIVTYFKANHPHSISISFDDVQNLVPVAILAAASSFTFSNCVLSSLEHLSKITFPYTMETNEEAPVTIRRQSLY